MRERLDRFYDYCYGIFLLCSFVALVFGVFVLLAKRESNLYYLLFGFLAYVAVICLALRGYQLVRK